MSHTLRFWETLKCILFLQTLRWSVVYRTSIRESSWKKQLWKEEKEAGSGVEEV